MRLALCRFAAAVAILCGGAGGQSREWPPIAGYTPLTDVIDHSQIDLDIRDMRLAAERGDWNQTADVYRNGRNSLYHYQHVQSIRSMSTVLPVNNPLVIKELVFAMFAGYWESVSYADDLTLAACTATGEWRHASAPARREACIHGAILHNLLAYIIHEIEDSVWMCKMKGPKAVLDEWGAAHEIDEAFSMYAGSLEASSTQTAGRGELLYAIADRMCAEFGTCDDTGGRFSTVNSKMLRLFQQLQYFVLRAQCSELNNLREQVVGQLLVPLVQGTLKYGWQVSQTGQDHHHNHEQAESPDVTRAQAWTYAAAIIPQVHSCDPRVAEALEVLQYNGSGLTMHQFAELKQSLESVYSCLGITCAEVGGYSTSHYSGAPVTYEPMMAPCSDNRTAVGPSTEPSAADGQGGGGEQEQWTVVVVTVMTVLIVQSLLLVLMVVREKQGKPVCTGSFLFTGCGALQVLFSDSSSGSNGTTTCREEERSDTDPSPRSVPSLSGLDDMAPATPRAEPPEMTEADLTRPAVGVGPASRLPVSIELPVSAPE